MSHLGQSHIHVCINSITWSIFQKWKNFDLPGSSNRTLSGSGLNILWWAPPGLASQTHFHKRGKGVVNCVYNCVSPHNTVCSNHVTVSCHISHYITIWVVIMVLKMVTELRMTDWRRKERQSGNCCAACSRQHCRGSGQTFQLTRNSRMWMITMLNRKLLEKQRVQNCFASD